MFIVSCFSSISAFLDISGSRFLEISIHLIETVLILWKSTHPIMLYTRPEY